MARARVRWPVLDAEGDVVTSRTYKVYEAGTGAVSGVTTTGTPFASSIYATATSDTPISTTQTTHATFGETGFWVDFKDARPLDIGVDGSAASAARVYDSVSPEFSAYDIVHRNRIDLVREYGLVAGDSTAGAANTAAFNAAVLAACASNLGATLKLSEGSFYFNNGLLINNAATPGARSHITFEGAGINATNVYFSQSNATSGITMGGNGYNLGDLAFPTIRKMLIRQFANVAWPTTQGPSGWVIEVKEGSLYPLLDDVWIYGARKGVRLGNASGASGDGLLGPTIRDTRIDLAGTNEWSGDPGTCLELYNGGDLVLTNVRLNGNSPTVGTTIGIEFKCAEGLLWDTITTNNVIVKDHAYGLRSTQAGRTNSCLWNQLYLDGISGAPIDLTPAATGGFHTWGFTEGWFTSLDHGVILNGAAGSGFPIFDFDFTACKFISVIPREALRVNKVGELTLNGNRFGGANTGFNIVSVGAAAACENFTIVGNQFTGYGAFSSYSGGTAGYGLSIGAGCDIYTVVGNTFRVTGGKTSGSILNTPGTAASRVVANNAEL